MKNVALITGASAGIGKELARIHAAKGGDLVLVARREQALRELKGELESAHGVDVDCLPSDLLEEDAPARLHEQVRSRGIEVEFLVNNAGFGGHGLFHERDWKKDEAMIQLNINALCELTHLFLQDMVARKSGRILNVASTAGFLPGPLQATYYATKAFVLSFSQAVAEEVREHGITVTALCPGPVATEFAERADAVGVESFKHAASADEVAEVGYKAMEKGRLVAIDDRKLSFLLHAIVPFLPRRTVLKLSRRAMEKE